MSPEDSVIWFRWWPLNMDRWNTMYFDVALGDGAPIPPHTDPTMAATWTRLTRKRADVVLWRPGEWHLIELRDHAQANAVGRLLLYHHLWQNNPPDATPLTLELITNARDADVASLTTALHIPYTVI